MAKNQAVIQEEEQQKAALIRLLERLLAQIRAFFEKRQEKKETKVKTGKFGLFNRAIKHCEELTSQLAEQQNVNLNVLRDTVGVVMKLSNQITGNQAMSIEEATKIMQQTGSRLDQLKEEAEMVSSNLQGFQKSIATAIGLSADELNKLSCDKYMSEDGKTPVYIYEKDGKSFAFAMDLKTFGTNHDRPSLVARQLTEEELAAVVSKGKPVTLGQDADIVRDFMQNNPYGYHFLSLEQAIRAKELADMVKEVRGGKMLESGFIASYDKPTFRFYNPEQNVMIIAEAAKNGFRSHIITGSPEMMEKMQHASMEEIRDASNKPENKRSFHMVEDIFSVRTDGKAIAKTGKTADERKLIQAAVGIPEFRRAFAAISGMDESVIKQAFQPVCVKEEKVKAPLKLQQALSPIVTALQAQGYNAVVENKDGIMRLSVSSKEHPDESSIFTFDAQGRIRDEVKAGSGEQVLLYSDTMHSDTTKYCKQNLPCHTDVTEQIHKAVMQAVHASPQAKALIPPVTLEPPKFESSELQQVFKQIPHDSRLTLELMQEHIARVELLRSMRSYVEKPEIRGRIDMMIRATLRELAEKAGYGAEHALDFDREAIRFKNQLRETNPDALIRIYAELENKNQDATVIRYLQAASQTVSEKCKGVFQFLNDRNAHETTWLSRVAKLEREHPEVHPDKSYTRVIEDFLSLSDEAKCAKLAEIIERQRKEGAFVGLKDDREGLVTDAHIRAAFCELSGVSPSNTYGIFYTGEQQSDTAFVRQMREMYERVQETKKVKQSVLTPAETLRLRDAVNELYKELPEMQMTRERQGKPEKLGFDEFRAILHERFQLTPDAEALFRALETVEAATKKVSKLIDRDSMKATAMQGVEMTAANDKALEHNREEMQQIMRGYISEVMFGRHLAQNHLLSSADMTIGDTNAPVGEINGQTISFDVRSSVIRRALDSVSRDLDSVVQAKLLSLTAQFMNVSEAEVTPAQIRSFEASMAKTIHALQESPAGMEMLRIFSSPEALAETEAKKLLESGDSEIASQVRILHKEKVEFVINGNPEEKFAKFIAPEEEKAPQRPTKKPTEREM